MAKERKKELHCGTCRRKCLKQNNVIMLLADTHLTPIIGLDIHFTTLPPFNPFHPFIGLVLDPMDYIPFIGATVQINGFKRGVSDTSGIIIPLVHIPLFTPPWLMTPIIGHEAMNFFSSMTVFADGTRLSPKGHMVMTCNDIGIPLSIQPGKKKFWKLVPTLFAPTSFSLPIPTGAPVMVGGPYVPDWGGALMGLAMSFGFGAIMKYGKKLFNKFLKNAIGPNWLSRALCHAGFEPVNLVNGAVVYDGEDFSLPGAIPFEWKRSWYSDSKYQGMLGHGCHFSYDREIELFPDEGAIGVRMDDGRLVAFPLIGMGESFYLRQEKLTLKRHENRFEVFDHTSQLTYTFLGKRGFFKLAEISNSDGFNIIFNYRNGTLFHIKDTANRNIWVETDAQNRILSATVETKGIEQKKVAYTYSSDGDMIAITDALNKTTRIEYENHLMVKKTDRNGQAFYWKYDQFERCTHTWGQGGWQEGYIEYHTEQGYNIVTDANGAKTTYYYTPDQLVTEIKDPLGNSRFIQYTEFMEVYREIDEEGNMTGFTYDDRGNRTSIVFPDGSTKTFMYDEEERLMIVANPQGDTQVFTYEGVSRKPKYIIEPDNSTTHFEYNEKGFVQKLTKTGQSTTLEYDDSQNLVAFTNALGDTTRWEYDPFGNVVRVHAPDEAEQSFEYDKLGRVVSIHAADSNVTQLTYNAYDEVIEARDTKQHVKFRYTPLGSLAEREQDGVKVRFRYDKMERLNRISNEHNEFYQFLRNEKGEIITEKGFDDLTRHYRRDRAGKVTKTLRPDNRWTEYEHNALGQITRAEHYDGTWEIFSYNKNGQLVEAQNQDVLIKLERDIMGRIVKETQSTGLQGEQGHEVISEYDKNGNRVHLKSSLGADVENTFDALGNLTAIKAQSGEQTAPTWEAKIKRNALGQEVERRLHNGITVSCEYDQAGRPIAQSVRNGSRETYNRQYTWSANHQLMRTINGIAGGNIEYVYDAFGNLASAKYEDGSYDYKLPDEVGNLYKTPERKDRLYDKGGKLLKDENWHYHYDAEGNLVLKSARVLPIIRKTHVENEPKGGLLVSILGDPESRAREQLQWQSGDWAYEWYGSGMLKSVKRPNGKTVAFEYDALGRRTAKLYANKIARYVWDGNVMLHEWKYALENRPKTVVNELGELCLDKAEPIENLITWVYDKNNFNPSAKIIDGEVYSIINDYLGTPVQAHNQKGEQVWERELDIYGKVRKLKGADSLIPFLYQGQYYDEETGLAYNRFRYYDSGTGAYISQDPIGLAGNNPTLYAYVSDSNGWVDVFGLDGILTIFSDTHDIIGHSFIGITEGGATQYIGQWPNPGFGIKDLPSITISDMGGSLNFNDTQYLNSPHLHSISFDVTDDQLSKLKQYISDFESGNTTDKGYNLRSRQCASFAYGASQAAGIKEMKMPWHKWVTPASLAKKIDSVKAKKSCP
jgi:RHS repeat-associated protein